MMINVIAAGYAGQKAARLRRAREAATAVALVIAAWSVSASAQQPIRQDADNTTVTLRPGDRVRLKVWREPDLSGEFVIDQQGGVVFPKLGRLDVELISTDSLRSLLIAHYSQSLRNPAVEVTVLRKLNVLGAVRNPGLYYVDPTTTIADALAMAGGVDQDGKQNSFELLRGGKRINVALSRDSRLADSPLQSGDQLRIPLRSWLSRNTALVSAALTSVAIVFAGTIR